MDVRVNDWIRDLHEAITALSNWGWEVTAYSTATDEGRRIHISAQNGGHGIGLDESIEKDGCDGQED
jgi:hypothetical protein